MDLTGPRRKIERAMEHLEGLCAEEVRVNELDTYAVVVDDEPEGGKHTVRFRVVKKVDYIGFALIFGDLLHNLRSALDHAAWLIACRSNPLDKLWEPDTARRIAFPITPNPGAFNSHGLLPFIADDARALLERIQPYEGTDRPQTLLRMHRLCNVDKHRVLMAGVCHVDLSKVRFRPASIDIDAFPSSFEWFLDLSEGIEDGAKIAEVTFARPGRTKVQVNGKPTAKIGLGSGGLGDGLMIEDMPVLVGATLSALDAIETLPDEPTT